jgi:hypothetical protein
VADEGGFGAGLQRAFQRGDGAAIPVGLEDGRAGLRIGQLRHVEVEHDRHLELTGLAEDLEAARIVEGHAELPFAADARAMDVVGGLEDARGVGPERVRAEADDEARGILFLGVEQVGERDAGMRAVGCEVRRVEHMVVFRRLLPVMQLPGKEPGVGDAVGVHIGDEAVFIALVPADVLVGVNEARGGGHGGEERAESGRWRKRKSAFSLPVLDRPAP